MTFAVFMMGMASVVAYAQEGPTTTQPDAGAISAGLPNAPEPQGQAAQGSSSSLQSGQSPPIDEPISPLVINHAKKKKSTPDAAGCTPEARLFVTHSLAAEGEVNVKDGSVDTNSVSPRGNLGGAYGQCLLQPMLVRPTIPKLRPGRVYANGSISVSIDAPVAALAGQAAIDNIKELVKEGLESAKEGAVDIANTKARVSAMTWSAATQKLLFTVAFATKNGAVYSCEMGKEPRILGVSDDENGVATKTSLLTGENSAQRVGSSFTTILMKCDRQKALGKNGKIEYSVSAFQNTPPYKNSSVYFGDVIDMSNSAYAQVGLGMVNSVVASTVVTQGNLSVDASVGATHVANGKERGMTAAVNASDTFGKVTVFGSALESHYSTLSTGPDTYIITPTLPQIAERGYLYGLSYQATKRYSLFGERDVTSNDPSCGDARSGNFACLTDPHTWRVGSEGSWGTRRGRLIIGAYYLLTEDPKKQMTPEATAPKVGFSVRTSGGIPARDVINLFKKPPRAPDDEFGDRNPPRRTSPPILLHRPPVVPAVAPAISEDTQDGEGARPQNF